MTYEYLCGVCERRFDVIKPHTEMTRPEECADCGVEAKRQFVPRAVYFNGTQVEHAEYNPGLGCVVKGKKHREEIARAKGLVEVGNDFKSVESFHKSFDTEREAKLERVYDDAVKGAWVGDGS